MRISLPFVFVHLHVHFGLFVEYAEANPIGQTAVPLMERDGKGKFARWMGNVRQPLEQRIQNKQNGIGRQNRPYVGEFNEVACRPKELSDADHGTVYALTFAMLGVLIYELAYNAKEQGNPFSFKV